MPVLSHDQVERTQGASATPGSTDPALDYGSNAARAEEVGGEGTSTPWLEAAGEDTSGPSKPTSFSTTARALFPALDTDGDGYLSHAEIDDAVVDPTRVKEEAAVIATLHALADELEELSDDEWGDEDSGVTLADLEAFERTGLVPGGLRERVRGRMGVSRGRIEGASPDLYGVTGQPRLEAVQQGSAGDCTFLAAVACVVVRDPAFIRGLIRDDGGGLSFTVTFPKQDPQRVARPTDAELALYAHGDAFGFWPAVLEKAYGALTGGGKVPGEGADHGELVSTAVTFLTGEASDLDLLSMNTREETARKLTEAFAEGRIVCAGIRGRLPWEDEPANGLPTQHAYSIIDWDPTTEELTLRNPWGHTERNDDGDVYEDGVFTMDLDMFLTYFSNIAYEGGPGVAPAPPDPDHVHEVVEGDTLSALATRYYGVMRLFENLASINGISNPDKIEVGQKLTVPRLPVPTVVVSGTDTLEGLAIHWYGRADRAADIAATNPNVDETAPLPVGQVVYLPMVDAELEPL